MILLLIAPSDTNIDIHFWLDTVSAFQSLPSPSPPLTSWAPAFVSTSPPASSLCNPSGWTTPSVHYPFRFYCPMNVHWLGIYRQLICYWLLFDCLQIVLLILKCILLSAGIVKRLSLNCSFIVRLLGLGNWNGWRVCFRCSISRRFQSLIWHWRLLKLLLPITKQQQPMENIINRWQIKWSAMGEKL